MPLTTKKGLEWWEDEEKKEKLPAWIGGEEQPSWMTGEKPKVTGAAREPEPTIEEKAEEPTDVLGEIEAEYNRLVAEEEQRYQEFSQPFLEKPYLSRSEWETFEVGKKEHEEYLTGLSTWKETEATEQKTYEDLHGRVTSLGQEITTLLGVEPAPEKPLVWDEESKQWRRATTQARPPEIDTLLIRIPAYQTALRELRAALEARKPTSEEALAEWQAAIEAVDAEIISMDGLLAEIQGVQKEKEEAEAGPTWKPWAATFWTQRVPRGLTWLQEHVFAPWGKEIWEALGKPKTPWELLYKPWTPEAIKERLELAGVIPGLKKEVEPTEVSTWLSPLGATMWKGAPAVEEYGKEAPKWFQYPAEFLHPVFFLPFATIGKGIMGAVKVVPKVGVPLSKTLGLAGTVVGKAITAPIEWPLRGLAFAATKVIAPAAKFVGLKALPSIVTKPILPVLKFIPSKVPTLTEKGIERGLTAEVIAGMSREQVTAAVKEGMVRMATVEKLPIKLVSAAEILKPGLTQIAKVARYVPLTEGGVQRFVTKFAESKWLYRPQSRVTLATDLADDYTKALYAVIADPKTAMIPAREAEIIRGGELLRRVKGFIEGEKAVMEMSPEFLSSESAHLARGIMKEAKIPELLERLHTPLPDGSLVSAEEIMQKIVRAVEGHMSVKHGVVKTLPRPTPQGIRQGIDVEAMAKMSPEQLQAAISKGTVGLRQISKAPNPFYRAMNMTKFYFRPFWLTLRPAYTLNNQISNFFWPLMRHGAYIICLS